MSPRRAYRVATGLRWTLIFFGVGLLFTIAVYVRLHDQQNSDRSEARVTAAVANLTAQRHNSIVCVTRPYLKQALARARQSENDKAQSAAVRARARAARISNEVFLSGLKTIPPDYDCKPLVEQLRKQVSRPSP